MTKLHSALDAIEVRHLQYFAVVAEENSFRRASERLFMAQPPLSRHIKHLEERLGVALFERHSKGLTLTEEGEKVLEIIQPLLKMKDETFARLREEVHPRAKTLRVGFSTAFEQGVFAHLERTLRKRHGELTPIVRATSPKLVREVRRGKLDAAIVALPLETPDLVVREMAYKEPLVAAIPEAWQVPQEKRLSLAHVNGRPLFWFKREVNPAFFDFAKRRFALAKFEPHYLEEPAEHDVLLARIAAGEGMGLFAASFAAIKREGVIFLDLAEKADLYVVAGIVTPQEQASVAEELLQDFLR